VFDKKWIRYAFRGAMCSLVLLFAVVDAATGCEEEDAYSVCANTCENTWIDCSPDWESECGVDALEYKTCMRSCTVFLSQN